MKRWSLPLTALLCLLVTHIASACSVPVFRYALEQWRPDPYIVIVFHRGAMTADQEELLSKLRPQGLDQIPVGNLMVRAVDLDADDDPDLQELWAKQETQTLPWMAVHQPPKQGPPMHVWSGEFNAEHVDRLLDSPVRQQVRKGLLDGESIVWVVLEAGNEREDDAAFKLLNEELTRLQSELKLPEIDAADFGELSIAPERLKLSFSTARLSRDDPREQLLVEMLLRVEPDLRDEPYVHQTMAFPIFGRGRALYALIGNGIATGTIEDACRFLTGACQCTVKAQNPGVDLLFSVDWDQYIQPALPYDESTPPLVGLGGFVDTDSETPIESVEVARADAAPQAKTQDSEDGADAPFGAGLPTPPETSRSERVTRSGDRPQQASSRASEAPSAMARNIMLVMGLLVAGVVIATLCFVGRSR